MIEATFKSSVGISMVFIVNVKVTQEGDFVIRRITLQAVSQVEEAVRYRQVRGSVDTAKENGFGLCSFSLIQRDFR